MRLVELDAIPPEEIIKTADGEFREAAPDSDADLPNAPLIHLALATNKNFTQNKGDSKPKPGPKDVDATVPSDEIDLFAEDDPGTVDTLHDEFQTIRDGLVAEGNDESAALIASLDDLMDATDRRDGDTISGVIKQLEQTLQDERSRLPETATPIEVASLDGIQIPFSPPAAEDDSLLGNILKALSLVLTLIELSRRRAEKQTRLTIHLPRGCNPASKSAALATIADKDLNFVKTEAKFLTSPMRNGPKRKN